MQKGDPEIAKWRTAFACIIHEHLPVLSTLMEMVDGLEAALGYLETVDATDKKQVAMALAVAGMASEYAGKLLDHFDLVDGPEFSKPDNLARARLVVGNLLKFVRDQIKLRQLAAWDGNDEQRGAALAEDEPTVRTDDAAAIPDLSVPRVDRGTFTVYWGDKHCMLGNTKEFAVFELLHQHSGRYVHIQTLIDEVWEGEITEKATIQKTVSNLRGKLKTAGMGDLKIDGAQKDHYALKPPTNS